jgi:hypothetical protein
VRALLVFASVLPILAQQPNPAAGSKLASPVPSAEPSLTGSIDVGYRWRTDVGGSFNTYRSIVNLGSGPKLLGTDFTIIDSNHRLFDQAHVRAASWGGDPYSTFHLDARKSKVYDFSADYRNIAYYNFLPSYADPLLARGIVLDEQAFDVRRRFTGFTLDLLPGNWFIPYFAYNRDSGSGTGVTTFVSSLNEYPVPTNLFDLTNLYRGGVRFERRRFHVTLEQGGTTFQDDQSVFQNPGSKNFGNVGTPVFGQSLSLTNFLAGYGIRGTSLYSRGLVTASLTPWLDLYGQFLYSQPDTNVHYQDAATGNFILLNQLLFYSGQQFVLSSAAKLPHTTASFGAEIRPRPRIRIVESLLTDRLHDAGSASSNQVLLGSGTSEQVAALLTSSLVTNYNQQQIELFFDATSKLTLRGGYRRVWGDANFTVLPPEGLVSSGRGELRRNVGLLGFTYRPIQKLSTTFEGEVATAGGVYFRTSLYNYQKVRAQARYQATPTLSLAGNFTLLNNHNPTPGINFNFLALQGSVSLLWLPAAKKWDLQGSYTRSTTYSEIPYLNPVDLRPQLSIYRDNAHTATALFSLNLPVSTGFTSKLAAGGSLFISSGSRPTTYYQPIVKLSVPLRKNLNWFAEWRYYGYGEAFYLYEGFRTNLVTTGVRYER